MNENQNEYVDINAHDNYPDSEQKIDVPTMKVIPLKKICMTIGELPTSYLETMTYYEMLIWFIEYLKNNIIPTVNNNAEAIQEVQSVVLALQNYINNYKDSIDSDVEELEEYMNNYFENLDVQEEINNKLDEMLEDGVLEQIIEQFLQLTSLICFDNVADMKASTNLANGSYAKTLGYYSVNDGGEALYKVRTITNDDVVDEGSIIALNDNTLIAELIYNDTLNVKQFGAKGDGETDDTNVLKSLFNSARDNNITSIYFPKGKYLVTDTLLDYGIDGLTIYGENDDIYNNSTIILRGADITVFNFGGVMELTGITYSVSDVLLQNLTFRDYADTYTTNVFATMHYGQHFVIQNCSISCRNKSLDLKHLYDSRFINTDFSAGGNDNDAMITIHGGKHASPTEIGWDSANCLTFLACRFERYFGCAIKTTTETQPDSYNTTYDPAIALNVNVLIFEACRFEAPTLLQGHHLEFNKTVNIRLNIDMTILDGQTNLQPIYFNNCINVIGGIFAGYNRSTIRTSTFVNFEQPIINIDNNCSRFKLDLAVGNMYSTYQLDYLININAGDLTRRTMDINLLYSGLSKQLYQQTAYNQNLNNYKEGREVRYGTYENGYGYKVDSTEYNSYFNNMTHDTVNNSFNLQNRYSNSANTNRTNDEYVSNDTFTFHRVDCGSLFNNSLLIAPYKYPSTDNSAYRSSNSIGRAIMYADSYPSAEITGTTFRAGDIIFKTFPAAGSNIGWVCTASGNPGTWKAFGTIES